MTPLGVIDVPMHGHCWEGIDALRKVVYIHERYSNYLEVNAWLFPYISFKYGHIGHIARRRRANMTNMAVLESNTEKAMHQPFYRMIDSTSTWSDDDNICTRTYFTKGLWCGSSVQQPVHNLDYE